MERTGNTGTRTQDQDLTLLDDQNLALLDNAGMPDGPNDGTFSIGPAQPVEDSQQLPAVSAQDEADAVAALHAGQISDHPDNVDTDIDLTAPEPDADAGEDLPSEDELAGLIVDVDPGRVDVIGFDPADTMPSDTLPSDTLPDDGGTTAGVR